MNHLTDEQLSARLDDALSERDRVQADAHLAGCEACRARLAEYSALDRSLARALAPDPGEAYFADFAERVSARIAVESDGAATPVAVPAREPVAPARRSAWAWLFSGSGFSLAASTAALVLVAGLAWMRFHRQDDVASALREQVPSEVLPEGTVPAPDSLLQQTAPPVANQAAPSPMADAAPPAGASRAREAVTTPRGEEAPARARVTSPLAAGTRLQQRDAAPTTPIAEMKRRALIPAQEKQETRQESSRLDATSGAPAPAASAPSATLSAPAPGAAKMANDELRASAELASPCGTLLDPRGQPIAGAQVVALGAASRTGTSGVDGRFCLPSLRVGDTLSVWRVGYDPLRVVVGPTTSLALRMEPISTVGADGGRTALGKAQDSAEKAKESVARSFDSASPEARSFAFRRDVERRTADVYANETPTIRLAVDEARIALEQARRDRRAQSYERAADRWERIGSLTTGQATYDARFQELAALREANRLQPSADRVRRLRSRLVTFLALVPKTLPERATALLWQGELDSSRPRRAFR